MTTEPDVIKVTHILYLGEHAGGNPFSGAENHVLDLLAGLADAGADVELIAMLWSGGPDFSRVEVRLGDLATRGVRVAILRARTARRGWRLRLSYLRCWAALRGMLHDRRDRVVHVHLDLVVTPIVAWLAGSRSIVISVHNDEPAYATRQWRAWLRVVRRMVQRVIAITDHVGRYYIENSGSRPDAVTTIRYGVPRPAATGLTRRDMGLPEGRYLLGFVGRLAEQKNLHSLIEAMAQCPGVDAALVGEGPLKESLRAKADALGLRNVHFLGAIPGAAGLMPLFDVFCLPSKWEGLGLVLIEAMLQRVPVIGSRRGAIPEVLGNGAYGMLVEPAPDAIAEAINRAAANPEAMRAMAIRAEEYALHSFTIERMVEQTIAIYRAADPRRRSGRTAWTTGDGPAETSAGAERR